MAYGYGNVETEGWGNEEMPTVRDGSAGWKELGMRVWCLGVFGASYNGHYACGSGFFVCLPRLFFGECVALSEGDASRASRVRGEYC